MMEPLSFEKGRVVQSTQGRDRGNYFLVTEEAVEGLVMIADGYLHRLDHPKRKKTNSSQELPSCIMIVFPDIWDLSAEIRQYSMRIPTIWKTTAGWAILYPVSAV